MYTAVRQDRCLVALFTVLCQEHSSVAFLASLVSALLNIRQSYYIQRHYFMFLIFCVAHSAYKQRSDSEIRALKEFEVLGAVPHAMA